VFATEFGALHRELMATQQRFAELEDEHDLQRAAWNKRFDELLEIDRRLAAVAVNQDVFKGEVRFVHERMEALGSVLAPGAGVDAIGNRFAEMRERLNALERRVRTVLAAAEAAPPSTPTGSGGPAEPPITSPLFDYAGFEQRFRGTTEEVLRRLESRYLDVLGDAAPVLDVGCGRGEFVDLLRRHDISAYGIDLDTSLVAEARAENLDVRHEDALEHLRAVEAASLGAIVSTQVVEHMPLPVLLEFIDLAVTRLRPGGLFIAETPNPGSAIVLSNSYIMDPTHQWPLHPALLSFLCESAGFWSVDVRYFSPADQYQLEHVDGPDAAWVRQINDAFDRLNGFLFGPQDYAVIATTRPLVVEASAEG
jgi:2-polyprenyl-3-methyl-5-hydroxy-6-metoxy-1,4-benzoquinol methylase